MNWDQVKGDIKMVQGKIKQKWAKLTDDDLKLLEGKKDEFLGRLQQRVGLKKEDAEREFNSFLNSLDAPRPSGSH